MSEQKSGAFAVWLTGIPAAGKSTIAANLAEKLKETGRSVQILDSDELRKVLTPNPTYHEEEREQFYNIVALMAKLLVNNGVDVIIAATANRRVYRDKARRQIERFFEVYVDCPAKVCAERDPKGLYSQAKSGGISTLPGIQTNYEPPEHPDAVIASDQESPGAAAQRIIQAVLS